MEEILAIGHLQRRLNAVNAIHGTVLAVPQTTGANTQLIIANPNAGALQTIAGGLTVTGAVSFTNTLAVTNGVTLSSTLNVAALATLSAGALVGNGQTLAWRNGANTSNVNVVTMDTNDAVTIQSGPFNAGKGALTIISNNNMVIKNVVTGTSAASAGNIIHQLDGSFTVQNAAGTVTKLSIDTAGNAALLGTLTIGGNLVVNGTTTTVNSTNLAVNDRLIHLNEPSAKGANDPVPLDYAGVTVYRGSVSGAVRDSAAMAWDEVGQKWLATLLSQDTEATLGANRLDFGARNIDTTGTLSVTGAATINGSLTLGNQVIQAAGVVNLLNGSAAQGLNLGQLLISNAYADVSLVPANGAYIKGATHLANTLTVDGATTLSSSLLVSGTSQFSNQMTNTQASTSSVALALTVTGDTASRLYIENGGTIHWGPGGATAPDTTLFRSAAGTLTTPGNLVVGGTFTTNGGQTINGNLTVTGTTTLQGNSTVGNTNQTVQYLQAVVAETDTRTQSLTYNPDGSINVITEKDGATTVKTTTFSYNADGTVNTATTAVGSKTITRTYSYDGAGNLTGMSKTVA